MNEKKSLQKREYKMIPSRDAEKLLPQLWEEWWELVVSMRKDNPILQQDILILKRPKN
jgi:hypothetical protein